MSVKKQVRRNDERTRHSGCCRHCPLACFGVYRPSLGPISGTQKRGEDFVFFQAEDGIRDLQGDWSSDVCSSDLVPRSGCCPPAVARTSVRSASSAIATSI